MVFQTDEGTRMRRQRAEQAIKLAMQGQWDDAVALNLTILESAGGRDVDAFNRLGRALMALGRNREARQAYSSALALDSANQIAKKNMTLLESKVESEAATAGAPRADVDPSLFVEETGKTGVTVLQQPNKAAIARITAGERVLLKRDGNLLLVTDVAGTTLGRIEPRMALRLMRLMDGGNEYAAAMQQITGDRARVIIKETYQHASQARRLSFPPVTLGGAPRPYTREGLVRYDDEDDDVPEPSDAVDGWDADSDGSDRGDVTLLDYQKAHEREERDEGLYDE